MAFASLFLKRHPKNEKGRLFKWRFSFGAQIWVLFSRKEGEGAATMEDVNKGPRSIRSRITLGATPRVLRVEPGVERESFEGLPHPFRRGSET